MKGQTEFEVLLDNAYIGVEIFCEQNGLTLGQEDFLTTGTCNCLTGATAAVNSVTQVSVCECDTGLGMQTSEGEKSCEAGKSCTLSRRNSKFWFGNMKIFFEKNFSSAFCGWFYHIPRFWNCISGKKY